MSLHWYACISTNTCRFETHHISLETDWWTLPNTSSIVQICSAVHEILADEAFTATDGLISQSFVVAFVHSTYVWIALIWGFPVQLSLWKLVYWLWRYRLNEVYNMPGLIFYLLFLWILFSTTLLYSLLCSTMYILVLVLFCILRLFLQIISPNLLY